jgi:D-alanyl-D-alanine carboxypeptidase (penicillin-binding protein 5/6)
MDQIADHRIASLDTTVTVPKQAAAIKDGGVGLVTGQQLTYRQLLNMMLIASANDAAEAVAIDVAGSQAAYVALMNAEAMALGLQHTYAVDPHGLGKRERSSADDLTILARHVLADPVLAPIVCTCSVVVPRPGHKARVFPSTDLLLGHYKGRVLVGCYAGIVGVKTGFTDPAGYCFVGAAKRGAVELVGVVLGTKSNAGKTGRFAEMRILLDWGFAHAHARTLASPETTFEVQVSGVDTVTASIDCTVTRVLLDTSKVVTTTTPSPTATAPISAGEQVGTEEFGCNGVTFATVPLFADADPPAAPVLPDLENLFAVALH